MTGVGLALPQIGPHLDASVLREFVAEAERLGYTSLWVQDHFMKPVEPSIGYVGQDLPIPEQYGTVWSPTELMAAAAAWSSRCLIGSSVLVGGYHFPAQLAGRLATIDQLSGGRLVVGLGVGWCAEEHAAVGVDVHTRGKRMDDFVPALLACWAEDPVKYEGPFFRIAPAQVRPKPLQLPRPTTICGGFSPSALARTARWFDGWNPAGAPLRAVLRGRDALAKLRDPGLPPVDIWHHTFTQAPGGTGPDRTVEDLAAEVSQAAGEGFREVIVDASFSTGITRPEDWLALPAKLRPLLDAAQG
jgi:probable F420-dependent oxidoreductase